MLYALYQTAADGSLIRSVHYQDGGAWPNRADGQGSALEIINPAGDAAETDAPAVECPSCKTDCPGTALYCARCGLALA